MLNAQQDGLDFVEIWRKFQSRGPHDDLFLHKGNIEYQSWVWQGNTFESGLLLISGATCRYYYGISLTEVKKRKAQ